MSERDHGSLPPAFYAGPQFISRPAVRDWWTMLHPPYTMWHLSYVVIGSCLVGPVDSTRLAFTVIAFFLAVGIGAHALDELHGRPLNTAIPRGALVTAAVVGIGGATVIGIVGIDRVGLPLAVFIVVGVVIAVGYNLELFGGRLHTDAVFAAGWGAFPLLTGYYAQHQRLDIASVTAATFAFFMSSAQRQLSTPALLAATQDERCAWNDHPQRRHHRGDRQGHHPRAARRGIAGVELGCHHARRGPCPRPAGALAVTGSATVVGGGPAGLMAAELLADAGLAVTVYEHMPSVGRKLLLAGRSGLNITHSEPIDDLLRRYGR